MPASHTITAWLQLLPPLLLLFLVIVLIRKDLFDKLPAFSTYSVFHVVALPTRFFLWQHGANWYTAYFLAYWLTEAVSALLTVAVIYELYGGLFSRYGDLQTIGRRMLNCIAGLVILIGFLTAMSTSGSEFDRWITGMFAVRQMVDVMRLGLVGFLLVFAAYFRMRWPAGMFGVSVGMAFYGSCELAGQALQVRYGTSAAFAYTVLVGSAYVCTTLIWLTYLLKGSTATEQSVELPANDLAVWNNALVGMLNR
jgi:hypothetical protein